MKKVYSIDLDGNVIEFENCERASEHWRLSASWIRFAAEHYPKRIKKGLCVGFYFEKKE